MSAISALGWLKAEAALPRLRGLAQHDPSNEVRAVALQALGHFHPQAADVTRAALHDPAWQVRSAAISVAYVNEDLEVADAVAATLLQNATAHFIAHMYLPKAGQAMYAAVAARVPSLPINDTAALVFGEFGDTRAIEPLRRKLADPTLTDDDAPRRESLITTLARLGDSSVTPLLKPLLYQHQMGISREAIPVFAQVMGAAGVGDLVPLLMQGDTDIEERVARALETIGTPEALAAVAYWKSQHEHFDENHPVPPSAASLHQTLTDLQAPLAKTRRRAVQRLGRYGGFDRDILPLLRDRAASVRREAAFHLCDMTLREVVTAHMAALHDQDAKVRFWAVWHLHFKEGVEIAAALVPLAHDPDPDVRWLIAGAVIALANYPDGIAAVRMLLHDDREDVRAEARATLQEWGLLDDGEADHE